MTVYLDAADATKNIDLLTNLEVIPITEEYKRTKDSSSNIKMWGITTFVSSILFVISPFVITPLKPAGILGFVVSIPATLKNAIQYYQRAKLPGNDLDEVYQNIGSKVEELATSEIPEEKQALLRKIEIIRHSILGAELRMKKKQALWEDFDYRLSRVQEQLNAQGVVLSREDHVQILTHYLENNRNAECAIQLIELTAKEIDVQSLDREVNKTLSSHYRIDVTDPRSSLHGNPLARAINYFSSEEFVLMDPEEIQSKVIEFLDKGISFDLMIGIASILSKNFDRRSSNKYFDFNPQLILKDEIAKLLIEYQKNKQIGVAS
ncbi:MAG: hypothetical protein K940chlam8_00669 [Chlamydiae bacterium]|nr:hypothetical protein [Chlamydiota bacterium]